MRHIVHGSPQHSVVLAGGGAIVHEEVDCLHELHCAHVVGASVAADVLNVVGLRGGTTRLWGYGVMGALHGYGTTLWHYTVMGELNP